MENRHTHLVTRGLVARSRGTAAALLAFTTIACATQRSSEASTDRAGADISGRVLRSASAPTTPFRAMSFNIRYGTARDGDNRWERRVPLVLDRIDAAAPHLLGLQECQPFQLDQLRPRLTQFEVIGRPRTDDAQAEACYLLVDRRRMRVEDSGTYWLSDTPDTVASKGWDAALPRICTWAVVQDRVTHARLLVANAHFDHRGKEARRESARLIAQKSAEHDLPSVLLGDFNAAEQSAPIQVLRDAGFVDTWRAQHPDAAEPGTFTGFKQRGRHKIDYVFASTQLEVTAAQIDTTQVEGRYPSDHFPVLADLRLPAGEAPLLMPTLDGEPWHIGDNPPLGELGTPRQEMVDHAIWQARDGSWQLWSCVRGTTIGRLLYAWEGATLDQSPWAQRGVAMRALTEFGESIDDWGGKEWIQAPHVVIHEDRYHMLYGGHRSELEHCQINLATSADGKDFDRYRNAKGQSRVFVGPGEARDPMTLAIDGVWHCYYTGNPDPTKRRDVGGIYCRTSSDLVTWSEPTLVSYGGKAGEDMWSAECPHVVEREGYYYLFRTTDYREPVTHVYRSRDPLDFGLDEDSHYVGTIAVAAPEIVRHDGQDYVSTVHDLRGGVQLQRMRWVDEREADYADAWRARCDSLWDFEDGAMTGWTVEGEALQRQPTYIDADGKVRKQAVAARGSYFVGTYEDRPSPDQPAGGHRGDAATGRARSPAFELPAGRVTFLIGGGRDRDNLYVALRLADGDTELFRASGHRENAMRPVTWDVRAHAGQRAYFVLVDSATGGWGHLSCDDFRIERD